jgi:hypothetical protein
MVEPKARSCQIRLRQLNLIEDELSIVASRVWASAPKLRRPSDHVTSPGSTADALEEVRPASALGGGPMASQTMGTEGAVNDEGAIHALSPCSLGEMSYHALPDG